MQRYVSCTNEIVEKYDDVGLLPTCVPWLVNLDYNKNTFANKNELRVKKVKTLYKDAYRKTLHVPNGQFVNTMVPWVQ